ncbi:hypothetical protein [Pseudomonas sp. R5(2019)]|uniref:hypothetical protein n=1 Tax=Pseudomonas sp. R5(2019) TaxID=2697566 RepID=UPI003532580B
MADALRGREFRDFDSFRSAFWQAVGANPELSAQFSRNNLERVLRGKAPYVLPGDHSGKRKVFEIHHVLPISNGGAVYDVDNLRVLTPVKHIELHSAKSGEKS